MLSSVSARITPHGRQVCISRFPLWTEYPRRCRSKSRLWIFRRSPLSHAITSPCRSTRLRNIIGDLELDNTLTSRDTINDKIRIILDEATDAWGIRVIRVELKNILPPREIQDAMEKQMKAERERRARILDAEGEKRSQILVAEGLKESAILKADAVKEQKIREAQGEAEAILTVQKANADALKMLNEAAPTDKIIQLKSLEAFIKAADGKATKIIIPSDIQSLAANVTAVKELWKDGEK